MKPTVYIETSVISYYTAKPSRDIIILAHQEITREWWKDKIRHYTPYVSSVVIDEITEGNQIESKKRIKEVQKFKSLEVTNSVIELAKIYLKETSLPEKARIDSYHLALSTFHGVDFLVTWNCKHIANGNVVKKIQTINEREGYQTPFICTPEELIED